jgi:prolipoprotein diacylglyceryltransferase
MANLLFLSALFAVSSALFYWGFKHLPAAQWQIMAAVPSRQQHDGTWHGINLTYYGFFNASACTFSCALIVVLMSSVNVPTLATLGIVGALLVICIPAAKIVARLVERKASTFTIGGASFVGILCLPWIVLLFNVLLGPRIAFSVPAVQLMSAAAIAYCFGEAFGRLACISFGCCYGKLLWHAPQPLHYILRRCCFVFRGHTKKVAYEANLTDRPLIPIQAVTAIVFSAAGLVGLALFLEASWTAAVVVPVVVTQVWRVISETLRADYRGNGSFSAYQFMALCALIYTLIVLCLINPASLDQPNITMGLSVLLKAPVLVLLEGLWLMLFVYLGRSSVTEARMSFHVVKERI